MQYLTKESRQHPQNLFTDIMLVRAALGIKPNYLLPELSSIQAALDQLIRCASAPSPKR